MKSILEELWFGNVCPDVMMGKMSEEEKELVKYITAHHEKLNSILSDEEKKVFEKYVDCQEEYSFYSDKEIFIYGFCLGARIMLEVMRETDE